jgi:hypothetical protein
LGVDPDFDPYPLDIEHELVPTEEHLKKRIIYAKAEFGIYNFKKREVPIPPALLRIERRGKLMAVLTNAIAKVKNV